MDPQFWLTAWKEGRTAFHRADFHEKLLQYFPELGAREGQRVLVPLCGKTKDLLWLRAQGLDVHGVELSKQAVEEFYRENGLSPGRTPGLEITCGDFFGLDEENAYDLAYDRAALVALPPPMRERYAKVITKALRDGGKYLLITFEYAPGELDGPPFSVLSDEIDRLYGERFTIRRVESEPASDEGPRLAAVKSLRQTVYVLEKKPAAS